MSRVNAPRATQEVAAGSFGEDVVAIGIGVVAGLKDQRRGAHALG
jgi:hypothetical protein